MTLTQPAPARRILWHQVPRAALPQVRKHGLLSSVELAKRPELLELARPDKKERAEWLALLAEEASHNEHRKGVSALFQLAPDEVQLPDNHPSKTADLATLGIDLDALLRDAPTTRLLGLELEPFDTTMDEAKWAQMSPAEQTAYRLRRKHELSPAELSHLTTQSPADLWKHYRPTPKPMYAPDVPHVSILTPSGIIDPKYITAQEGLTKQAAPVAPPLPRSGPEGLQAALAALNLDEMEQKARDVLRSGKISKKRDAIQMLHAINGLKRNQLRPEQLVISRVPVLPPVFRPYSQAGDTFVPGDANELYGDLLSMRDAYREHREAFGEEASSDAYMGLYDAVRASYGYGDPVNPKTRERGVSGFLKQVTGTSPKFSFAQRRLFSKPVDSVSRGVITVNPDLDLDEVGIPRENAWTMFKPYVQRTLVRNGMRPSEALRAILERNEFANRALEKEVAHRPVLYSRAPAWHKYNAIAGYAKLVDGDMVEINSMVGTGLNADHDGDTINVHVPSLDESVQEAKDKLLPSKMLFSIRERGKVIPVPKHETIWGAYEAASATAHKTHKFDNEADALRAVKEGRVGAADDIELPD
jgi:hypothetical protein